MAIFQEINALTGSYLYEFNRDDDYVSNKDGTYTTMHIRDKTIFEDFNNEQAKDVTEYQGKVDSVLYLNEEQRYREDIFRRYWMTGKIYATMCTKLSGAGDDRMIMSPINQPPGLYDMPTYKNKKLKWIPLLTTDVVMKYSSPSFNSVLKLPVTDYVTKLDFYTIRYEAPKFATYAVINSDYTFTPITLQEVISRFGDLCFIQWLGDVYDNTDDDNYSNSKLRQRLTTPYTNDVKLIQPYLELETVVDSLYNTDGYHYGITDISLLEKDKTIHAGISLLTLLYNEEGAGLSAYSPKYSTLGRRIDSSTTDVKPILTPLMSTRNRFIATLRVEHDKFYKYFHVGTKKQFLDFFNALGMKVTESGTEALTSASKKWKVPPNISPIIPEPIIPERPVIPEPPIPQDPDKPVPPPPVPPDPNHPGKPGKPGGGGQQGGNTAGGVGTGNTQVNISEPVKDGSTRTGTSELSSSYAMTYTEVEELQKSFLEPTLWTNLSGYFKDEQSGLINLLRFPFSLTNIDKPSMTMATPISIVGVPMKWAGGQVDGYKMQPNMLTRLNLGTLEFKEYFGSFLDYDPYTKINIYLPYIGYKQVSANAVMGKTLTILYNISYLDGSCMAILKADDIPIYTIEGRIGYQVPLAKGDIDNIIQGAIKTGIGALAIAGVGLATGGAGAAAAAGGISTTSMLTNSAKVGALGSTAVNTVGSLLQKSTSTVSGTAQGVHARAMSNIPFAIIERPITNMPLGYGGIAGFQTNLYTELANCKGMTVCDNVKLDGFGYATESEKDEIKMLLSRGVIL